MERSIWVNDRGSVRVRAFLSVLDFLKKNGSWQVVDSREDGQLWVLDGRAADLHELWRASTGMPARPYLVVIDPPEHFSRPGVKLLKMPLRAREVMEILNDENTWQVRSGGIKAGLEDGLAKPAAGSSWRKKRFRLKVWPNVAKYGKENRLAVTITASKLLRSFHDYNSVQQWGLAPPVLDAFLDDAYRFSMLEVKELVGEAEAAAGRKAGGEKNSGLIQRLLKRLTDS
ncbi:MAG: hypothetical protein CSB24_03500 [Deltaproteobacteria bacterium]|nr:MAG: hypothetical protein CSB24_03500 [Deltaproteobacteria bacterium]